jgi:RNA polymerase sigma-70 factor (ECF subfamily)
MDFGPRRSLNRQTMETALNRPIDEHAFRALVEPYHSGLHAHCYRMLGSLHDAEDALQETLLRAWRGLPGFEGRSSLRAWLYRIATNACLTALERSPRRMLATEYGPPSDPRAEPAAEPREVAWLEPYPDERLDAADTPAARYEQRESVELAFVAALQHLPPLQRAVLILRDVLGFSPAEIATALDASPAAIYSALQRAHKAVEARAPEQSQQATLRALGDARLTEIVDRFTEAWERGDTDAIVELLTEDAVLTMPPRPTWIQGRDAVGIFLAGFPLAGTRRWRVRPARASGQPALAIYAATADSAWTLHSIEVLTLAPGGRISEIAAFMDPPVLEAFDGDGFEVSAGS